MHVLRFLWLILAASALAACDRERIDVADVDAGLDASETPDALAPPFGTTDASVDAPTGCGPPPTLGACGPCSKGYVIVDGSATCDCCP